MDPGPQFAKVPHVQIRRIQTNEVGDVIKTIKCDKYNTFGEILRYKISKQQSTQFSNK